MATVRSTAGKLLENPRFVTRIFASTEYAWIWLIARLYVGWNFMDSGWHKLQDPGWMSTGASLNGFWQRVVVVPETGRPAIVYDWYREFLLFLLNSHSAVWFAKMVAIGEFMVGLGLMVGLLTGIAAFFGALMNWNFMLAGSASTNPILGLIGISIMIAWKTAGWWGLDRFALPYIGAPWQKGKLLGGEKLVVADSEEQARRQAIEEWVRMIIGAGLILYAVISLSGAAQVIVLLLAAVVVAVTGLGVWPIIRSLSKAASTR